VTDLRERVAIVTGAGRGIGRAYALRCSGYGARVIVNDAGVTTEGGTTHDDPAAEVVREITEAGGEAIAHRGDIGEAATGAALVQLALETWDRLDIVINNAGFGRPRMVFNLSDDEWDDVVRVHLRGTFMTSRPACAHWRAQAKQNGSTYGRLINTATGLLVYGGAGQSNYVAAKAGIQAFTEAVATEMAPYGVTANTIMPGANTRLAQIGWRTAQAAARDTDVAFDTRDPVHVAEFCCYLAAPEAGWISGQTFQVHGGTVEHITTWNVDHATHRTDRGLTADDLTHEIPRLFGASAKRADPPPAEWKRDRPST
jgi:NAD(P)-dependent dehydrogenase (short-subunit alcohol dehydrogenase family)